MDNPATLNRDLHFCEINGEFIFLDVTRDAYFAFTQHQSQLFRETTSGPTLGSNSALVHDFTQSLYRRSILVDDGKPCVPSVHPSAIQREQTVLAPPICGSMWSYLPAATLSFGHVLVLHRTARFKVLVERACRWKANRKLQASQARTDVHAKVEAALALQPLFFSNEDECLFRSLYLLRFLSLYGISANWVFGVQHSPFAAHCWVEFEGEALNDYAEHTHGYTPIMIV